MANAVTKLKERVALLEKTLEECNHERKVAVRQRDEWRVSFQRQREILSRFYGAQHEYMKARSKLFLVGGEVWRELHPKAEPPSIEHAACQWEVEIKHSKV